MDLRPLTVFVGPSNTGKSYLAILVYALHRAFRLGENRPRRFHTDWLERLDETVGPPLRRCIEVFASIDLAEPPERLELQRDIVDVLVPAFLLDRRWDLADEIASSFGLEHRELVRHGAAEAQVVVRATGLVQEVTLGDGCTTSTSPLLEGPVVLSPGFDATVDLCMLARTLRDRGRDRHWYARASRFVEVLREAALPMLVSPLDRGASYLPADRTGAVHAHAAVVSGLIGSAASGGPRSPLLSGVLADFLRELGEIDIGEGDGLGRSHAQALEEQILNGAVNVRRDAATGYPAFYYRPDGWDNDLPIKNASSMVSELAPVVLYMRHRVGRDSLLIIEEPEAHLHPGMQVELIRLLAGLVNAGVRVLLTTHSEWVLEELSNVVLASRLPADARAEIPAARVALAAEDVGVWLFRGTPRTRGSVVEEVRLDSPDQLYSRDYSGVANHTYNDWVRIGNLAGDSR